MSKNSSSFPILVLGLMSLVLASVLLWGIYSIENKNREAKRLSDLAEQVSMTKTIDRNIQTARTMAYEDLKTFDEQMFTGDKAVSLIEEIEDAGELIGVEVRIVSVTDNESEESEAVGRVIITMEAIGAWQETFSFLRAVESLPYRVIIDESSLFMEADMWKLRITVSIPSFD